MRTLFSPGAWLVCRIYIIAFGICVWCGGAVIKGVFVFLQKAGKVIAQVDVFELGAAEAVNRGV